MCQFWGTFQFLKSRIRYEPICEVSRFKEIGPEIIVQPGLSKANHTADQTAVLAAACSYLKETVGVDLDVICSE